MQQQQQQQVQNQQQQLQQQQQIRPTGGTCVTRPVNAQPLLSHSPGKLSLPFWFRKKLSFK